MGAARLNPSQPPILITGSALISPLGLDRAQTWQAILDGRCGIGPLAALEQKPNPDKGGGQAPDLPEDENPDQPREVRYLRRALADLVNDARLIEPWPYPPHRCAILLGTTLHGMRAGGRFLRTDDPSFLAQFLAGAALSKAAAGLPIAGITATTCSACSSGLAAIGLACTLLQSGQYDLVIAGGYDTISEYVYAGFNALRLVADGPPRPFTTDRKGMKTSEGFGLVCLERAADARRRAAKPLALIRGFGESSDSHHLTQPHPEGDGAARAILAALASARLSPDQIQLISAHATATPDNDAAEFTALRRVFGDRLAAVPVIPFKAHLGHTLGGAGIIELILASQAMRDQTLPPTPNLNPADLQFPELTIHTGPAPRPHRIDNTLNTSLGFGGSNTCLILGRADVPTPVVHAAPAASPVASFGKVCITGIGLLLPWARSMEQLAAHLKSAQAPPPPAPLDESDFESLINARRLRRISAYARYTLAAATLACRDARLPLDQPLGQGWAAILGSAHGAANYCETYYRQIVAEGINAANPMLFAEGVPNVAAAHLSLSLGIQGGCQSIIGTHTAGVDALNLAALRIATGQWDRAIVSAAEEHSDLVVRIVDHFHAGRPAPTLACGAVAIILESEQAAGLRAAPVHGWVTPGAGRRIMGGRAKTGQGIGLYEGLPPFSRLLSSAFGLPAWLPPRGFDAPVHQSLYDAMGELHSAGPLAAIAAGLIGAADSAAASQPPAPFAILDFDCKGQASTVHIQPAAKP